MTVFHQTIDLELIRAVVVVAAAGCFVRAGVLLAVAATGAPGGAPGGGPGGDTGGRGPDWKWWLRVAAGAFVAGAVAVGVYYLSGSAGSPPGTPPSPVLAPAAAAAGEALVPVLAPAAAAAGEALVPVLAPAAAAAGEALVPVLAPAAAAAGEALVPVLAPAAAAAGEALVPVLAPAAAAAGEALVPVLAPAAAAAGEVSALGRFVLERVLDDLVEPSQVVRLRLAGSELHSDFLKYADPVDLARLAGQPGRLARANEALGYFHTPAGAQQLSERVGHSYRFAPWHARQGLMDRLPADIPPAAVANLSWPAEIVRAVRPPEWDESDPVSFAVHFACSDALSPVEWLLTARDTRGHSYMADRMVAALEAARPLYLRNVEFLARADGFAGVLEDNHSSQEALMKVLYDHLVKATGLPRGHPALEKFDYTGYMWAGFEGRELSAAAQLAVYEVPMSSHPVILCESVGYLKYAELAARDWVYSVWSQQVGLTTTEFLRGYPSDLKVSWADRAVRRYSQVPVPLSTGQFREVNLAYFQSMVDSYLAHGNHEGKPIGEVHADFHRFFDRMAARSPARRD